MNRDTGLIVFLLFNSAGLLTQAHSSRDGFARSRLIFDRRAFYSRVRSFALRGTRVATRFGGR